MKTSVIEVHDMLSVLSVDEVEKRIGEVPGVESVTVNFATGGATVRYDETRLEIGDVKSSVRQRGYEPAAPATPETAESQATPAAAPLPTSDASKPSENSAAALADPAPDEKPDKAAPDKG